MGGCPPTDRRLPPGLWAVAPQLMGGCPRAYGRLPSALWAVAPQSKFGVVGPCARTLQGRSERDRTSRCLIDRVSVNFDQDTFKTTIRASTLTDVICANAEAVR